jgi:hypothetical protein
LRRPSGRRFFSRLPQPADATARVDDTKTSQYFQSEIFIFFALVTFGEQDSAQSTIVLKIAVWKVLYWDRDIRGTAWASGEEPLYHQSINVGDPNGAYASYSFALNGGLDGIVYRDVDLGGEI